MTAPFQAFPVQLLSKANQQLLHWQESEQEFTLTWHSENHAAAPKKIFQADDRISADLAYKMICEGTALLWRGDYHQAKQLLTALSRRIDRKVKQRHEAQSQLETFHKHRQAQAQKAQILSKLLIPINPGFNIPLRRAPDVKAALAQVLNAEYSELAQQPLIDSHFTLSLRELLGIIGAYEWRKNGVTIAALGRAIHPFYGVFSPLRGEYLDLIAKAQFSKPAAQLKAFDIGTGTGVIAAILANRGVKNVIATEQDPRALACAKFNLNNLGFKHVVNLVQCDLFPNEQADLIICNPPWLPAKPNAAIEFALYDQNSQMLKRFLSGLKAHLAPAAEAWLIMSDLAEHLGLRQPEELTSWIKDAGLTVKYRSLTQPLHKKSQSGDDPLHFARSQEKTSLWCLQVIDN